eukprot:Skav221647  [mRNA]  locus=scaffold1174:217957:218184:- [translate_table: standard]
MRAEIEGLLKQLDVEKQQPQDVVHMLQLEAQRHEYARAMCQHHVNTLLSRVDVPRSCRRDQVTEGTCGARHHFSL